MTDAPQLLIVDDSEDNRYTLAHRLTREGYDQLSAAADGREALQLLEQRPFDLVLLDIMMPHVNGFEVLSHIKGTPALRDIPVIMISALDEMDSVVRCIELGAEDYLLKPFNAVLLRARVGACLEKKRLLDEQKSHMSQIDHQRQRADDLLHAILPSAAVQELKETDTVQPRRYDDVVVLFCDIVGFTAFCDQQPPEAVVEHLQAWVDTSESIIGRHGLEKIKTIGDAVMVTGGLIEQVADPEAASVRCGLELADAARRLPAGWEVRVGINRGSVVAGVIGRHQFMYDLWGDTVNTAARIVAQARPGAVVASERVWERVADRCLGESLGRIQLKGKDVGGIEMFRCDSMS